MTAQNDKPNGAAPLSGDAADALVTKQRAEQDAAAKLAAAPDIPPIEVNSRRDMATVFTLDPRSKVRADRHYRFVRLDQTAIMRAKMRGYSMVKETDGVKLLIEHDTGADGSIRVGDTILMSCPEKLHQEGRRELRTQSDRLLEQNDAAVREAAKRQGVRVITNEPSEPKG